MSFSNFSTFFNNATIFFSLGSDPSLENPYASNFFLFDWANSLAGIPATVTLLPTDLVTTEFAPTLEKSPTSIAPSICAPEPMITLFPIVGCLFLVFDYDFQ